MIGEQAGCAAVQRLQRRVGQRLGAEGGVAGAADVVAAEAGNHVVERGNVPAQAGEADSERGMRVQHGAGLRVGEVEVAVKAPFGGWLTAAASRAVKAHKYDVFGFQRGVVHAGGRDQEAAFAVLAVFIVLGEAQAEVAGGAFVQAGGEHAVRGGDQAVAGAVGRLHGCFLSGLSGVSDVSGVSEVSR